MTTEIRETNMRAAGKAKPTWDENLKTLIYALVLAMAFRSFVFEPFHIPSGSMKDSLLVGDYLFVTKYSYGYSHYSFPFGLPRFDGRILTFGHGPQRGDVVVFRPPGQPNVDYIKRLIGLPGDRIQVRLGELYINDARVPRLAAGEYVDSDPGMMPVTAARYVESLPGGVDHDVLDRGERGVGEDGVDPDNTAVYTVPPRHYFMMGDNRDNSRDSRFPVPDGVGFVPEENIVGPAKLVLFSVDLDGPFWQLWKWPTSLRWNRFFHPVH